jgi:formylglycine-generating enzyme required for sulfatase activity
MPRLLVCLLLAVLLLAACDGVQTPPPSSERTPLAAATATTPPPTASSTPRPSPTPNAGSPNETVTVTPEDGVEITAPPAGRDGADGSPSVGDTWVRPADGAVMVYVPGGTFPMGSAESDAEAVPEERPQHMVTLDGFWIDQAEVTNAQFLRFLNEQGNSGVQGSKMIVLDQGYTRISQEGDRFVTTEPALDVPVVMVTWHGAASYCEWAVGRLPTEAEWEYAARGPEGNLYPWGNVPPDCDLANYGDCSRVLVRVGSRPAGASWCGALDLAGNVWEWVNDWFGPYSGLPQENPVGPASGDVPVLRGGGWHSPRWEIRAAYRQHEVSASGFNG